jgi:hypothetical protein
MLYRLSYASELRAWAFSDTSIPTDPMQTLGTIFKGTTMVKPVQATWQGIASPAQVEKPPTTKAAKATQGDQILTPRLLLKDALPRLVGPPTFAENWNNAIG